MTKQTKLLVEIPELDEFLEIQLSKKKDTLVERIENSKIVSNTELKHAFRATKSFAYSPLGFERAKNFIKKRTHRSDYVAISTDPIPQMKELYVYLTGYNKK